MNAETIARLCAVKMPASALREVLAILADDMPDDEQREPLTPAERSRRYRARQASRNRHETVTETVTDHHENSDAERDENVTERDENVTPPSSPPSPLHPPPTPTPEKTQGTHAREETGSLFPETDPPHKRIKWTVDTGWTGILDNDRERWTEAFPACDIVRQLSAADLWLRANPKEAHKSNFFRFMTGWLTRSQDRGGDERAKRQTNETHKQHYPVGSERFGAFSGTTSKKVEKSGRV